jgi:hypothetical protein
VRLEFCRLQEGSAESGRQDSPADGLRTIREARRLAGLGGRRALRKTFTLDEAQTLLPVLSALLEKAREAALRAGALESEMQELSQRIFLSGGLHVDVPAAARRRAEREKAMQEARAQIEEISEIGVEIPEQEDGGLEFPCLLEGRTVMLCWKLGEDEILAWREADDTPGVRKPVDGRFSSKRDRERPN